VVLAIIAKKKKIVLCHLTLIINRILIKNHKALTSSSVLSFFFLVNQNHRCTDIFSLSLFLFLGFQFGPWFCFIFHFPTSSMSLLSALFLLYIGVLTASALSDCPNESALSLHHIQSQCPVSIPSNPPLQVRFSLFVFLCYF
jgi:hypothetical protein